MLLPTVYLRGLRGSREADCDTSASPVLQGCSAELHADCATYTHGRLRAQMACACHIMSHLATQEDAVALPTALNNAPDHLQSMWPCTMHTL